MILLPVVGMKYYSFSPLKINDYILLIKEDTNEYDKNAVAVYNTCNQKIGYISAKQLHNIKARSIMRQDFFIAKLWAIFQSYLLVDLTAPKNPPSNNYFQKRRKKAS